MQNPKSKIIIFVSLFLIVLSFASLDSTAAAKQKEIVEGESVGVVSGGTIRVYELEFQVKLNENATKVFVDSLTTTEFSFIDLDECKKLETFRLCFDRASGNTAYLSLFSLAPEVEIEQVLQDKLTIVGEETSLNITITNYGEKDTEGIEFSFIIPEEIRVTKIEGDALIIDNKVFWNGSIEKEGEVHEIVIFFKPVIEYEKLELLTEIKYFNYYDWLEDEDESEHDSKLYFTVEATPDAETLYVGNSFKINLSLQNDYLKSTSDKYGKRYRVKTLQLAETNYFEIGEDNEGIISMDGETAFWRGAVNNKSQKDLTIEILPKRTGILTLPFELEFYPSNETNDTITLYPTVELDITAAGLEIYPQILAGATFNSSTKKFFDMSIRNTDDKIDLSNLNIIIKNNNGITQRAVDVLPASTQKSLKDLYFITGTSNSRISEDVEITITYENTYFEKSELTQSIRYFVEPDAEIVLFHNITDLGDDVYAMAVVAKNSGDLLVDTILLEETLPESTFLRGNPSGTLDELKPGHSDVIAEYKFVASDLNISAYLPLGVKLQYELNNVSRVFSENINLSSLIYNSVEDKDSFFARTVEGIEGVFFSLQIFVMFIVSVIILITTVTVIVVSKKEFSLGGVSNLKARQGLIDKRRTQLVIKETDLGIAKRKINTKMGVLKNFLEKTKKELERKLPVIEEKKEGINLEESELMREKKVIDDKIAELREIETKLLAKHHIYETEKSVLNNQENELKGKFETIKTRLGDLGGEFEKMLEHESIINQRKEGLNVKELTILSQKQKLLKAGTERISDEKVNVLQEKVRLEHERNSIEEELYSLGNRKKDISSAQDKISKQRADIEKDRNVFDMNKGAVSNALNSLQKQSEELHDILEDSKHSDISPKEDEK